jgi:IS30 family transposase
MARHNKEMTTEMKQMILRLKWEGYANRKIAEIIGRDHSTITKFLKRYDERNSVENEPKTWRKKFVTERGDRVILRSVKVNRRDTLGDLTNIVNERLPVSTRTVRRRLKCHGYMRRRVRKTLTVSLNLRLPGACNRSPGFQFDI